MLKINRKVEYALMVLKLMSEKTAQELTSAREVCDKFNTPFDTTSKVMQQLNLAGILASVKGVKGGYFLNYDLQQLSYLQLAELVEGRSFTIDCHEGPCELLGSCNISTPIRRLNNYVLGIFSNLAVKELLMDDPLQLSELSLSQGSAYESK
jgi:Rrf2 family protein